MVARGVVVLLALGGCLEPHLTTCSDGLLCPIGLLCDEVHHTCINQDQLNACAGAADGAVCTTPTLSGECFGGVCFAGGCGNGVLEPGEACDDGNRKDGDGCSANCLSNETCGNGIVDTAVGESCDDGNFISHDGCNSRCGAETLRVKVTPLAAQYGSGYLQASASSIAYDVARSSLFIPWGGEGLWSFDGQALRYVETQAYGGAIAVYDSDHQWVVGPNADNTSMSRWDGTTWTNVPYQNPLPTSVVALVYDQARHGVLAIGDPYLGFGRAAYLDPVTATWAPYFGVPFDPTQVSAAYDEARQRVVALPLTGTKTWEWDGTTWTSVTARPPGAGQWSMTYHVARGHVVALGAATNQIFEWDGATWTDFGVQLPRAAYAHAWYEPATSALLVLMSDSSAPAFDLWRVTTTGATELTPSQPGNVAGLYFDPVADRTIVFDGPKQPWSLTDVWQKLAPTTDPAPTNWVGATAFAYDPIRGGPIGTSDATRIYLDGQWQIIGDPVQELTRCLAYDYSTGSMMGAFDLGNGADAGTFVLPNTDTTWTMVDSTDPWWLVYDLGTSHMVGASTDLVDRLGDAWVPTFALGSGSLASWFARKSVISFTVDPIGTGLWERRGGVWSKIASFPVGFSPLLVDADHGRLVGITGSVEQNWIELQFASGAPDETCVPGVDADGDGLAGCDDPDCWQSCHPQCPYDAVCP
jgi:cysteine-rich repeat protein